MGIGMLFKGLPGHPLHPPLTDVTIGAYAVATVSAVLDRLGVGHHMSSVWWIALLTALVASAATATTGFADWIELEWGSARWRTATVHMLAMLTATVVFLGAALAGRGDVTGLAFGLTIGGFAILMLGGWLGGSLVFVHGLRVRAPGDP